MNYRKRPKDDHNTRFIIDHFRSAGMLRHPDYVGLPPVSTFAKVPYEEVVEAVKSGALKVSWIESTGFGTEEFPLTRWTWVDEWVANRNQKA